jgi:hypothetical protein
VFFYIIFIMNLLLYMMILGWMFVGGDCWSEVGGWSEVGDCWSVN